MVVMSQTRLEGIGPSTVVYLTIELQQPFKLRDIGQFQHILHHNVSKVHFLILGRAYTLKYQMKYDGLIHCKLQWYLTVPMPMAMDCRIIMVSNNGHLHLLLSHGHGPWYETQNLSTGFLQSYNMTMKRMVEISTHSENYNRYAQIQQKLYEMCDVIKAEKDMLQDKCINSDVMAKHGPMCTIMMPLCAFIHMTKC